MIFLKKGELVPFSNRIYGRLFKEIRRGGYHRCSFYFKRLYLKKSFYYTLESFFYIERQYFPSGGSALDFMKVSANMFNISLDLVVNTDDLERMAVFFDVVYHIFRAAVSVKSVTSLGKGISRKDPRFSSVRKNQRMILSVCPTGFIGYLEFLGTCFFYLLKQSVSPISINWPKRIAFCFRLPEYQKLLKLLNRHFSKRLYFKCLYAENFSGLSLYFRYSKLGLNNYFIFRLV